LYTILVTVGWLEFNIPFQHKYGYIRDVWLLLLLIDDNRTTFCSFICFMYRKSQCDGSAFSSNNGIKPSEQMKHQLTLTREWYRRLALSGVKCRLQTMSRPLRWTLPAAMHKSLAWYAVGQRTQRYIRPTQANSVSIHLTKTLIEKTDLQAEWPLHYVFLPLQNCLPSCRPLWTDTHPANIISQWRDEWKSASVVNSSPVDDPTIQQGGFDLPRQYWVLLNRFRTNQDHCASVERSVALQQPTRVLVANVKRCNIFSTAAHSPSWRGLQRLYSADDIATERL